MSASAEKLLTLDLQLALQDFALDVQAAVKLQGVTGLFGPSGSGKSTLLRVIAGFETTATGRVSVGDRCWLDSKKRLHLAPHRRPVGYVFQDARLFMHLDVAGNLDFAATRNGGYGPQQADVIDALDLAPLLQRDVAGLSGGERQRVALGRTLLCNPQLLLLDEPLAALDVARKEDILPYLESLQARFSLPTIYVSHSVDEILRLADEVIVLDAGRVHAQGATRSVLNDLHPALVGSRFDVSSVLDAVVVRQLADLSLTELQVGGQAMFVPQRPRLTPGEHVLLRVRAGEVALATSEPRDISIRNVLCGRLLTIEEFADQAFAMAHIEVAGSILRCQLTRQAVRELQLQPDMPVFALLKTASFDAHE